MPSTFRSFLQRNHAKPDESFNERDESYFVGTLLMFRLGLHGTIGHAAFDTVATLAENTDDPLTAFVPGPETTQALIFVSTFLCFFAVKPRSFMESVQEFKQYFIPGFAADIDKRIQLSELVTPAFSNVGPDPAQWPSFQEFFRAWKKEKEPVVARQY